MISLLLRRVGGKRITNPQKTVWRVDWIQKKDEYLVAVEGGGFLYKMVRSMVGALLDVGYGKLLPQDISVILASGKEQPVSSVLQHMGCAWKKFLPIASSGYIPD